MPGKVQFAVFILRSLKLDVPPCPSMDEVISLSSEADPSESSDVGSFSNVSVFFFAMTAMIKQTFVIICRGRRCVGEPCTAGEETCVLTAGRL